MGGVGVKIKFGLLIFCVVFTFFIGSFFAFFVNTNLYENLNLLIKVPSFVFPVVWSIIYLLLGISFYLILISNNSAKEKALKYFLIQLFINSIWTLFFFGFSLYILSFILIILLIILVVLMIIIFYKINKIAGLINSLYLIWLIFASILNLGIIILN